MESISQEKLTMQEVPECPAEGLLKVLSGKWKSQIFKLATVSPLRFNTLLRTLPGANKQSLAVALKELEQAQLLEKKVVKAKPLHIEYTLTAKAQLLVSIFRQIEQL